MEEAIHLTHFASEVVVLVRRDALRASKAMQERALNNPKITFMRLRLKKLTEISY